VEREARRSSAARRAEEKKTLAPPALIDAEHALKDARDIGQAATLMYALHVTLITLFHCGNFATANAPVDELVAAFGPFYCLS
jgi:hypothetical protein